MADYDTNRSWAVALESIKPDDWVNIPTLLRGAIFLLKDSVLKQDQNFLSTEHNIFLKMNETNQKLETIEGSISKLAGLLQANEQQSKKSLHDLNESISLDIGLFKETFLNNIDYKLKSTDKKMLIAEETVQSMKKYINSLMTTGQIEKLIDSVAKETKNSVKKEIHDIMLAPELKLIKEKIQILEENQEQIKANFEEKTSLLEKTLNNTESASLNNIKNIEYQINSLKEYQCKEFLLVENKIKDIKQESYTNSIKNKEKLKKVQGTLEKSFKYSQNLEAKIHELKDMKNEIEHFNEIISNIQTTIETLQKKNQTQEHPKIPKPRAIIERKDTIKSNNKGEIIVQKEETKKEEPKKDDIKILELCKEDLKKQEPQSKDETNKPIFKDQVKIDLPKIEIYRKDTPSDHGYKLERMTPEKNPLIFDESFTNSFSTDGKKHLTRPTIHDYGQSSSRPLSPHSRILSKNPSIFSSDFEDKFNRELNEHIIPLEKSLRITKMEMQCSIHELKEKLSWLPMNLSEIKGKDPNEARLYTIEARQRQEENVRGEQFNYIVSLITQLRNEISNYGQNQFAPTNLPQIFTGKNSLRISERRLSAEPLTSSENIKNCMEDGGKYSNPLEFNKIKALRDRQEKKMSLDMDNVLKKNQFLRKSTLEMV
ncbi:hypothetical protein SteCoe_16367 [Stentor coeruleus]|uniref:Uncharacterized protein n=1 Tax=Stentor coeruleus TaxID=5963 RepID=A0A1R2C1C7_9CILI|nr:hypothetical protein SteCoe_16367 [Stentor coeruleus]